MIGSFWNLCRACPSMPVDKLHSEYRSTYRWHEYTGSRQDVVRRPPQSYQNTAHLVDNQKEKLPNIHLKEEEDPSEGRKMEPAMPRRKKHPEMAYRTHEFLTYEDSGSSEANKASVRMDRARSEERAEYHLRSSRRSRSEGPPHGSGMRNILFRNGNVHRRDSDPDVDTMGAPEENGLLRKAMSRISTEYRLQFAWPQGQNIRADDQKDNSLPRKSLSMGAIKPTSQLFVHRRRQDIDTKDASELEPLVNDAFQEHYPRDEKESAKDFNTEYKKKFRPFSQYDYMEGKFTNREDQKLEQLKLIDCHENGPEIIYQPGSTGWFKEVVELRKKAGEYKHRGWGTELAPEHITALYNKQVELWEQVSRRSSLSALSLASTMRRSYTKEEKEQENNKKSSPTKIGCKKIIYNSRGMPEYSSRIAKDLIRHHLERTTGGSEYDGLILSPTREKLEPTIPKKNEDITKCVFKENQKSSPKKDPVQKTKRTTQKGNTKSSLRTMRSQSAGPGNISEKNSPKRLSRSTTVKQHKTPRESTSSPPCNSVKQLRPSSLNTGDIPHSKYKANPSKYAKLEDSLLNIKTNSYMNGSSIAEPNATKENIREFADQVSDEKSVSVVDASKETNDVRNSSEFVKSPPEPTRVKSPEQIMMRSPDPVNWTVPLDTGKTFTVTQNVREGEIINRPHSEVKAWTPPEVPPPSAQSAPPELSEQGKTGVSRRYP